MGNPHGRPPVAVADPERRFCAQCGERNFEHAGEDKVRCHDCGGTPVPARFYPRTGERMKPPPLARRSLLVSYAGGAATGERWPFTLS